MKLEVPFRAATVDDCRKIAELYQFASDGVTNYVWSTLTSEYPGLTPIEIGTLRYANEQSLFGYKNCVVVEQNNQVISMMVTFATEPEAVPGIAENQLEVNRSEVNRPEVNQSEVNQSEVKSTAEELDVLAPYNLEAPDTWYICALALFPDFRGQGVGSQFLSIAHQQAAERNFSELSLLCFEQNTGALKLYERNGFKVIARTPVVPHPLIRHTGDLLLMTTPVRN